MSFDLDHLIVFTRVGAPALTRLLAEVGLVEGAPNTHVGQGTANRRVFFDNAYLELLFVVGEEAATSALVSPTALGERGSLSPGTCPIGVCVRPSPDESRRAPFSSWEYDAPFLPQGRSFPLACTSSNAGLPLVFSLPGAVAPMDMPSDRRPPLRHGAGALRLARATIVRPRNVALDEALAAVESCGAITVIEGDVWHLVIELEGGEPKVVDLRPELPLSLSVLHDAS